MKKKIKVSIVVPIYNVEKYIHQCINSILKQTYKNIEIILVDDGSPDKCGIICDDYKKQDKRIKVIHKPNAGLGYARNSGMDIATGDYIYFIDSDDYIEPNLIEECVKQINKNNSDIVIFGMQRVDDNNNILSYSIPTSKKDKYTNEEILKIILPNALGMGTKNENNINIGPSAWSTIISLKKIRDLKWKFVSEREIISEDMYSILSLYKHIDNVTVINKPLYNYRVNLNSLTQIYREDRFEKNNIFYTRSIELCKKLKYSENILQAIATGYFNNLVGVMKSIVKSKMSCAKKIKALDVILKNTTYQTAIKNINLTEENIKRKMLIYFSIKKNAIIIYLLILLNLKTK